MDSVRRIGDTPRPWAAAIKLTETIRRLMLQSLGVEGVWRNDDGRNFGADTNDRAGSPGAGRMHSGGAIGAGPGARLVGCGQLGVSKFWVAITALQAADAGRLDVNSRVTLRREDLTLFHQPVAADIGPNGYTTTIDNFMFRALTTSDNTCNDVILRQAGGPQAVRAMIERNQLEGVRFGPGERLMQSQIAGLQWSPAFSVGNAFYQARSSVPAERRRTAFENYIEDPIDGATPDGITSGLVRLQRGELLSRQSTARLLAIMSQTRTGPQRLSGGLAPGWQIAHKTGTGQVLGTTQAGYNDIGILTSPEGRHYAVAVMIGRTATPLPVRMELMQNVTRAVIAYNEASAGSDGGRYQRR